MAVRQDDARLALSLAKARLPSSRRWSKLACHEKQMLVAGTFVGCIPLYVHKKSGVHLTLVRKVCVLKNQLNAMNLEQ